MTKILSVKDGFENQSQQSCLKFKFPAKTINQSGTRTKSRLISDEPRDHASLSHNKGGLKNIVALNTHDKNFICQGWLWHHQSWKPITAKLFEIQISRQNHQPIREQEEKPAGITWSRKVFPWRAQCQKSCLTLGYLKLPKLDPCGGGKGGLISKLRATLNKVVSRRLSKLNLFSYALSLLIATWGDWRLVNKGPEAVWLRAY